MSSGLGECLKRGRGADAEGPSSGFATRRSDRRRSSPKNRVTEARRAHGRPPPAEHFAPSGPVAIYAPTTPAQGPMMRHVAAFACAVMLVGLGVAPGHADK